MYLQASLLVSSKILENNKLLHFIITINKLRKIHFQKYQGNRNLLRFPQFDSKKYIFSFLECRQYRIDKLFY